MTAGEPIWVGADPGGKGNFGVAILRPGGSTETWRVSSADEATEMVVQHATSTPAGVGIDAPLWWSSGPSSDRQADKRLRRDYHLTGGQVQTANSLRGAALVQGAMFVQRIRERFPGVGVTETHPKAVLKALKMKTFGPFAKRFSVSVPVTMGEHERDAVISAVAAREGFEHRWPKDLSLDRNPSEQDPKHFWLAPIYYYWPET